MGQNILFYLIKILKFLNFKSKNNKLKKGTLGVASHPILPGGGSATPISGTLGILLFFLFLDLNFKLIF